MASKRKRINLSVSEPLYRQLSELCRKHGIKKPCRFIVALIEHTLDMSEGKMVPNQDTKYIKGMFRAFGEEKNPEDGEE